MLFIGQLIVIDTVHELLRSARLEHPFDYTQGPEHDEPNLAVKFPSKIPDTKLIKSWGVSYKTTPFTDPNIKYNIMM